MKNISEWNDIPEKHRPGGEDTPSGYIAKSCR